jgi:hypothetical protein
VNELVDLSSNDAGLRELALFAGAGGESSEDTCSDGELSAQSNGSLTQLAYCAPDRMTKFSRLSRFGMTYKPLTEDRGEELLTLYLAAFPVRTSAPQEKAQESMEPDPECGATWRESLAKYDQNTSMWKTPPSLLSEDSTEFLGTWPRWGSMQDGVSYQQPPLAPHTKGIGSGLWPTPTAHNAIEGAYPSEFTRNTPTLTAQANWPTPVKSDYATRRPTKNWKGSSDLPSVVWTANGGTENPDKPPAKLNPVWVEWLMGWPLGWTDLKPLATDKFRSWQQQHGVSSSEET